MFGISTRRTLAAALLSAVVGLSGCQQTPAPVTGDTTPSPVSSTPSPIPVVDLVPGKIKVGIGFEDVALGQTKEEVFKALGEPEETDANEFAPGQTYACYYSKGVELTFADDKLAVITLQSPNADAKYQTYTGATEEGLGVGTSAEEIVKSLGEPADVDARALRYPKLGVWFRLDTERGDTEKAPRAQSVQVMKPE